MNAACWKRQLPAEIACEEFDLALPGGNATRARVHGPAGAPAVVVLGGISADRRPAADAAAPGWWPALAGAGRPLDPARLRLISFDYLVGAPGGQIHCEDQAAFLARLLDRLGIARLPLLVGASYGGMVGLAFAARYRERLGRLVVISAAERAHPMATAWRAIQRRLVRLGVECGAAEQALVLARALAMTTYRTPAEFEQRFTGPPSDGADGIVFPVERYLLARGAAFVERIGVERFLALSESIDLHEIDASSIDTPADFIGVRQDQLVPVEQMRELARRYGGPCRLHEIDSPFGHDAFLKECDLLAPLVANSIDTIPGIERAAVTETA
jgi:homoserine O-acetyltransferase/O-succinyltransferase